MSLFLFTVKASPHYFKMKSETDPNLLVRDVEIFNDIRNYIRRKINNADTIFFGNVFKSQKDETRKLLTQSIENRESNSAIICGAPGCGKTALINSVLKELYISGMIDNENAVVIRLNGLLHRDDRLALQDMRKQLKVTYSGDIKKFASFQENLLYILNKLKEQGGANFDPYIVIIMDEFHLFCEHKNQILLYNLFDIVQSSKAPLCVIGLTYYTDVMNLMEKRVLSRFSHRIIWMTESVKVEERLKLFHDIFTLHPNDLPNVADIYKFVWNKRTNELVENKEVKEVMKRHLEIDSSQAKFRNLLHKLFNTVTFELPLLNVENIKYVFSIHDSYTSILSRLSLLEMALVIAVKHQSFIFDREPFNFEMIYNEYLKFSSKNSTNLVTDRSVVLKAFQRIQELEIIVPLRKTMGNALGKVPIEYQLYHMNVTDDQINEAVRLNRDLTVELRQWAVYNI